MNLASNDPFKIFDEIWQEQNYHVQGPESKNIVKKIIKLRLNHWCHMDYFNNVFTIFLGLEYCYTSNNILICVSKIVIFGMTWGWVINVRIWIFLWTNYLMMDWFLSNMQLFASQDINGWTGDAWITCELLWCFYRILILTAPIHFRGSTGEQVIMQNFSKSVMMKNIGAHRWHLYFGWPEGD